MWNNLDKHLVPAMSVCFKDTLQKMKDKDESTFCQRLTNRLYRSRANPSSVGHIRLARRWRLWYWIVLQFDLIL